VPGLGPEHAREPVPAVDRDDREGEIDDLLLAEMFARRVVERFRYRLLRYARHRLGPGQGRALARREKRRFLPCRQGIEALFRFAARAGVDRVHVDAEGAVIDLRRAHLHQFEQLGIDVEMVRRLRQFQHRLIGFRRGLGVVEQSGHRLVPFPRPV